MPRIWRSGAEPPGSGDWWYPQVALARLDRRPVPRMTLIMAPQGSGKSRLVRYWLSLKPEMPWIWLDFDRSDVESGERVTGAWIVAQLRTASAPWAGVRSSTKACLVLAGLDFLDAEPATRLLEELLDELPAGVRMLLLSTGGGLPASCAVRLAGDLDQLGPAELWWPAGVLAQQLAALVGVTASAQECRQVERLTHGWPAGVLILGRAMRRRPEALSADAGTPDPDVLDFLTAQVLDRLPDPVRRFVLHTSVLADGVLDDPGTCAVLVPDANPHAMIARLRRHGLTEPGSGLRYHAAIRAAALQALAAQEFGARTRLIRIAGVHALSHGRDQLAASCFAECEDWTAVFAVLTSAGGDGFRGWEPERLHATVRSLPDREWADDAQRRALFALAAALAGDPLLAGEAIARAPASLAAAPWWPAVTGTILALCVNAAGGPRAAYRAACSALAWTGELGDEERLGSWPPILGVVNGHSLGALTHLLAARAAVLDGDLAAVRRHSDAAAALQSQGAQVPRWGLLAGLATDAYAAVRTGALGAAQRYVARAERLAEQAGLLTHPMLSLAVLARVELLRARGRTVEALAELRAGAALMARAEPFVAAASGGRVHAAAGQILRVSLALDQGDTASARIELDLLAAEGDDDLPGDPAAGLAVAQARLRLLLDDVAGAQRALESAPETAAVAAACVAVALRRQTPEAAQLVLENWPAGDTLDGGVRRLLARAAVALSGQRRQEAEDCLAGALAAAEPDGHVQVFLDAPAGLRSGICAVLTRWPSSSPWRQELLRRLDDVHSKPGSSALSLTRRELVVLTHLAGTLTHAQIAAQLFVSENTLKSHCRNLYRKLGVNSQLDAVRVARARGWLEPADVVLDLQAGQPSEVASETAPVGPDPTPALG